MGMVRYFTGTEFLHFSNKFGYQYRLEPPKREECIRSGIHKIYAEDYGFHPILNSIMFSGGLLFWEPTHFKATKSLIVKSDQLGAQ